MDAGDVDWIPAPHERHLVAPGVSVQLRHQIDKVVLDGVAFYRLDWQGVIRAEPRVVREEGARVVCSLWALGHSLATTLAADIAEACATLAVKGGLHELDRKRVKTGTGY